MSDSLEARHRRAMDFADRADAMRRKGQDVRARQYLLEALALEKSVAEEVAEEPSRSVLYRSAAWLAFESGRIVEARRLANAGKEGQPPREIEEELEELERHLSTLPGLEPSPLPDWPTVDTAEDTRVPDLEVRALPTLEPYLRQALELLDDEAHDLLVVFYGFSEVGIEPRGAPISHREGLVARARELFRETLQAILPDEAACRLAVEALEPIGSSEPGAAREPPNESRSGERPGELAPTPGGRRSGVREAAPSPPALDSSDEKRHRPLEETTSLGEYIRGAFALASAPLGRRTREEGRA